MRTRYDSKANDIIDSFDRFLDTKEKLQNKLNKNKKIYIEIGMGKGDFITKIAEYISAPHKYADISNFMSSAISSLSDELINYNDPKSFVRLRAIANKIWFVPYNNLDEITSMAKDQYEKIMQKNQSDGDINE